MVIVKRGLLFLFVVLLSASCATNKPEVVTKTEVVEKKVPVYKPVPDDLTDEIEMPVWPEGGLFNSDLSDWIKSAQKKIKQKNAELREIRRLYGGNGDVE